MSKTELKYIIELRDEIKELKAKLKKLRATKCPPISDGDSCICPIEELGTENEKLKGFLQDALPHIECTNNSQSGLITAIGEYLLTLKAPAERR